MRILFLMSGFFVGVIWAAAPGRDEKPFRSLLGSPVTKCTLADRAAIAFLSEPRRWPQLRNAPPDVWRKVIAAASRHIEGVGFAAFEPDYIRTLDGLGSIDDHAPVGPTEFLISQEQQIRHIKEEGGTIHQLSAWPCAGVKAMRALRGGGVVLFTQADEETSLLHWDKDMWYNTGEYHKVSSLGPWPVALDHYACKVGEFSPGYVYVATDTEEEGRSPVKKMVVVDLFGDRIMPVDGEDNEEVSVVNEELIAASSIDKSTVYNLRTGKKIGGRRPLISSAFGSSIRGKATAMTREGQIYYMDVEGNGVYPKKHEQECSVYDNVKHGAKCLFGCHYNWGRGDIVSDKSLAHVRVSGKNLFAEKEASGFPVGKDGVVVSWINDRTQALQYTHLRFGFCDFDNVRDGESEAMLHNRRLKILADTLVAYADQVLYWPEDAVRGILSGLEGNSGEQGKAG